MKSLKNVRWWLSIPVMLVLLLLLSILFVFMFLLGCVGVLCQLGTDFVKYFVDIFNSWQLRELTNRYKSWITKGEK